MNVRRCIGLVIFALAFEMGLAGEKPLPTIPNGWLSDYGKAQDTADRENKDILLAFSGMNWCPYSKKLNAQILSKKKFVDEAKKTYVLVMIDVLRKGDKCADGVYSQNRKLCDEFQVNIPGIVITDAHGREKKRYSGFIKGTVSQYLDRLRNEYGCVSFCSKMGFTPEMVNVTNEFSRCMPMFRQVFGSEVDGFDFRKSHKVHLITESETSQKLKDGVAYVVGKGGIDEVRRIVSRIAIDAYGQETIPNQEELVNYFARRFIAKDASQGSKLFSAWDQIGLNSKIVMRNYFLVRNWFPKFWQKKVSAITINEEAFFMSAASEKDAFEAYGRYGIKVSPQKSFFGRSSGLRFMQTVPHGWTEEEIESL